MTEFLSTKLADVTIGDILRLWLFLVGIVMFLSGLALILMGGRGK